MRILSARHCVGFDPARCRRALRMPRATRIIFWAPATASPRPRSGPRRSPACPRRRSLGLPANTPHQARRALQGYGMQRRAYGEQVVRAGCVLAAITGNVGVPGGWASGLALHPPEGDPYWNLFPVGENPVNARIPVIFVDRGSPATAVKWARRMAYGRREAG